MASNKALCIELSGDSSEALARLREGGWDVYLATDLASARRLHESHKMQVGILSIGDVPLEQIAWVEDCLHALRDVEWVGIFDAASLESPTLREIVLDYVYGYHTHPVSRRDLDLTLNHALRRAELKGRSDAPNQAIDDLGMIGNSAAIEALRQQICKVAKINAPVLIGGESGSGKELAARAIHQRSRRAGGPFIAVNCGAIAPSLVQSELFGYERGAFTGATATKHGLIESASGGTIFLDEIGDLPLELQTNLLRFLQEHTIQRVGSSRSVQVDARVVAASHVNLANAVAAGRFREDLFYRLNVLPIVVPALRERLSDVPELAQHFLKSFLLDRRQRRVEGFSRQAMAAMAIHSWPGNVRELYNRVQRALVMADQRMISPVDLGLAPARQLAGNGLDGARTTAERDAIAMALGRVDHNVTHAARELGISRMTLYRLMDKHGLAPRVGKGRLTPLST